MGGLIQGSGSDVNRVSLPIGLSDGTIETE